MKKLFGILSLALAALIVLLGCFDFLITAIRLITALTGNGYPVFDSTISNIEDILPYISAFSTSFAVILLGASLLLASLSDMKQETAGNNTSKVFSLFSVIASALLICTSGLNFLAVGIEFVDTVARIFDSGYVGYFFMLAAPSFTLPSAFVLLGAYLLINALPALMKKAPASVAEEATAPAEEEPAPVEEAPAEEIAE